MDRIPISDYPNYSVDRSGNIFGPRGWRKPQVDKDGYLYVQLHKEGKVKNIWLHKLICTLFNGPMPFAGAQVLHKNGVKKDIRPDNLYWGTHQQNMTDMVDQMLSASGEDHPDAKLTWSSVREIRRRALTETQVGLAAEFGVTPPTISYIVRGITWKESPAL